MSEINIKDYVFQIRHLSKEEGGGYLIEFPDLPGCMSDGESIEEAINNGYDAAKCWLAAAKESGREIPSPNEAQSGKWVQRVPKSVHTRLIGRAKREGVSLNTLVVSMISDGLNNQFYKIPTTPLELPEIFKKSLVTSSKKASLGKRGLMKGATRKTGRKPLKKNETKSGRGH